MRATRLGAALVGTLLVLSGCAGDAKEGRAATGTGTPSAAATVRLLGDCLNAGRARLLSVPAGTSQVDVGVLGDGAAGVVIAYERNGRVCTWLPLADKLVTHGYRVAVFDYSGSDPARDVELVTAQLRKDGVRRVFIIGGSLGGAAVLAAGTTITPPVAGVVNVAGGLPDGEAHARRLRVPLLLVSARDDSVLQGLTTSATAWMNRLYRAAANAPERRLVLVPGYEHASELFDTPQAGRVENAIIAFLDRHRTS